MRIGIDAHVVGNRETGNETYVANLVSALAAADGDNRYQLYVTSGDNRLPSGAGFNQRLVSKNSWIRFALNLPYHLLTEPVDLLHVQYVAPPFTRCPLVATIHDVSYNFIPAHLKAMDRWRVDKLFPWTAKRAARIITGTAAAKEDIVKWLNVEPEKITVIPYGIGGEYKPIEDKAMVASVIKRLGLPPRYILYVGSLQPRKNLVRLIEAFARLKTEKTIKEKLVIAGKKGWLYDDVLEAPRRLGVFDEVIFTDYVKETDLPYLYNGAKVFVMPSLHEGFGFPPLEAMASGIPVVASQAPALPEVLGEAAIYVDPTSVDSIAKGIFEAMIDDDKRLRMTTLGRRRAATFSWQETARQTLEVYRQVLTEESA